jgi:uncharacterized membrane protein YfcA
VPGVEEFIVAWLIVLGAGCVSGLAGFGFGLISVPPLLLMFGPATVIAVQKVLMLGTSWITLVDARKELRIRVVLSLLPWATIGLVAGVTMLKYFPSALIKLMASVVVIGFSLVLLRGITPGGKTGWWSAPLAGLASGTLSTSTGLSGPPVVMLFTLRSYSVHTFRATVVAYFILLDLIGLPTLISQGLVDRGDVILAASLAPPAIAGRFAGIWLARRVSRATFYRVTLILLLGTGVVGAITAGMSLAR